mmetsp:Transcript_9438/g.28822  ORF Transcript_9438/g.28822 Transcript_9438/m.28822 type:complete len:80 (-) Transcript_9438:75-314(-)
MHEIESFGEKPAVEKVWKWSQVVRLFVKQIMIAKNDASTDMESLILAKAELSAAAHLALEAHYHDITSEQRDGLRSFFR